MGPKMNYRQLSTYDISSQATSRQSATKPQSRNLNLPGIGTWNLSIVWNLWSLSVNVRHTLLTHNPHLLTIMHFHQRSCLIRKMRKTKHNTSTTYNCVPI